jgi:hypothetical protein
MELVDAIDISIECSSLKKKKGPFFSEKHATKSKVLCAHKFQNL